MLGTVERVMSNGEGRKGLKNKGTLRPAHEAAPKTWAALERRSRMRMRLQGQGTARELSSSAWKWFSS